MPGPRRKFRERPKKLGARKNVKVKDQKKRLVEGGLDEAKVAKLTPKEAREALKTVKTK